MKKEKVAKKTHWLRPNHTMTTHPDKKLHTKHTSSVFKTLRQFGTFPLESKTVQYSSNKLLPNTVNRTPVKLSLSRNTSNKDFIEKIDVAEVLGNAYRDLKNSNSFISKLRLSSSFKNQRTSSALGLKNNGIQLLINRNNQENYSKPLGKEKSSALSVSQSKHSKKLKFVRKVGRKSHKTALIQIYS